MTIKTADLHTHSNASDGTLSPSELVEYAKINGLSAIALTDHDTIKGITEAKNTAHNIGIELISGVEISVEFDGEMHILGLFVNESSPELEFMLTKLQEIRHKRNLKIINTLKGIGINIDIQDVIVQGKNKPLYSLSRVHIAKALVAHGYAKDISDAFYKFIGYGKCGYVSRQKLTAKQCINLIKNAGGITVLAHPFTVAKTADLNITIKKLKALGIDAVECIYPLHNNKFEKRCIELANRYNLLITGGSDFHGENKPDILIGKAYNNKPIDYDLLEKIKMHL